MTVMIHVMMISRKTTVYNCMNLYDIVRLCMALYYTIHVSNIAGHRRHVHSYHQLGQFAETRQASALAGGRMQSML